MAYEIVFDLDVEERRRQKQCGRDRHLARLRRGAVSAAERSCENDFFAARDLPSLKIVAMGGCPLR